MILTNKQEEGLRIAIQRFKDGEPYTCIAGYANSLDKLVEINLWTKLTKL